MVCLAEPQNGTSCALAHWRKGSFVTNGKEPREDSTGLLFDGPIRDCSSLVLKPARDGCRGVARSLDRVLWATGLFTASTALALQRVSLGYERQPAAASWIWLAKGGLTAIVGPNGAGKSTLLKGMVGELKPMAGRIVLPERSMAYLPQQASIDRTFPMTVTELVAMGLWRQLGPFGGISKAHRSQISHALAAVGLTGFEGRRISALSGGQVQRVLFARLLIQEADVFCWTSLSRR